MVVDIVVVGIVVAVVVVAVAVLFVFDIVDSCKLLSSSPAWRF